jgi:hypothetical protein
VPGPGQLRVARDRRTVVFLQPTTYGNDACRDAIGMKPTGVPVVSIASQYFLVNTAMGCLLGEAVPFKLMLILDSRVGVV